MSEEVLVSKEGGVLIVTINRPEAKNAMNAAAAQGISAAMDELDNNAELSVGIITGADKYILCRYGFESISKGRDATGRR
jgi:enoyl-CoA hydratase